MQELIYVYHGKDEFLVQMKLEEMLQTIDVDEININKYDLIENTSEDVLEDLRTVSFFSEKKVIIVKNLPNVLKSDQYLIDEWIKYINKPNEDVILFIILDELIDNNLPLGKAIFNNGYIQEVESLSRDDYPNYVKKMVAKYSYTIDEDAIFELIARTNNDLSLVNQELEKLVLFTYDSKHINKDDVIVMVNRNLEENIYELTNNLLSGNKNKTIEVYYDLIARNEDPLRIMNNIVAKIRELMHTKLLIERGYQQNDIQNHFNVKSGRAFYLMKNANEVAYTLLEDYIKKLSHLDHQIKSGKIDKKIGLELFLLGA
ncbi:MAG TPA: DNA polymerase III subunit delta [Acholeplasmataceae bacterium]|nr:DNA polymerase III subunit delta [Acholeplasmataceae bacterium]